MAGAWSFLLVRSRRDDLAFGFLAAACWFPLAAQAQQRGTVSVGVAVDPDATPQALQLEVYLNDAPAGYVASFNRRADGTLTSPAIELRTVGVTLPEGTTESEVPLNRIPGLRYSYDEAAQIMRLVAGPTLARAPKHATTYRLRPRSGPAHAGTGDLFGHGGRDRHLLSNAREPEAAAGPRTV